MDQKYPRYWLPLVRGPVLYWIEHGSGKVFAVSMADGEHGKEKVMLSSALNPSELKKMGKDRLLLESSTPPQEELP